MQSMEANRALDANPVPGPHCHPTSLGFGSGLCLLYCPGEEMDLGAKGGGTRYPEKYQVCAPHRTAALWEGGGTPRGR